MLELTDLSIITLIFLFVTALSEIARYLDMKSQKVLMEATVKEMRTEFKNSLQELKNAGTGLKTSLSRIIGSVDVEDRSMTEVALQELMRSDFIKDLLAKGAAKLGVSGPGIPKLQTVEETQELILKKLSKKEQTFLKEIEKKLTS